MSPKLAVAVDPIFLHVLDLLEKIQRGASLDAQEERLRVRALIDQAEAILGAGEEWELAKYAIASWIDEMLVDASWEGREWWSNNVLEMELFNSRLCAEQFFLKAQEASTLTRRDALEVFYVCVVLGFRGLYHDPHTGAIFAETHGLPADLSTWARQAAMSIRLGQGRQSLAGPGREIQGAPPLTTRAAVVWPWLVATMVGSCAFLFYVLF